MVYRRGREHMKASLYEQEFAQTRGVVVRYWSRPRRLLARDGRVRAIEFETPAGETYVLDADVVFKAIGQKVLWEPLAEAAELLELRGERIVVDEQCRTSLAGVWAGGDCVHGGEDLTVSAVQDGKVAALSIDRSLRAGSVAWRT
jgi:glutamate synthase (NADPH/NADH) small chain